MYLNVKHNVLHSIAKKTYGYFVGHKLYKYKTWTVIVQLFDFDCDEEDNKTVI